MTPELTGSAAQCTPADMIAFLAGLPLVSRPVISKWFRQNPAIATKQDSSPVTIADQSVERDLRAAIAARFPDDMIMGEEFASTGNQDSAYRWIIHPSISYLHGYQAHQKDPQVYLYLLFLKLM